MENARIDPKETIQRDARLTVEQPTVMGFKAETAAPDAAPSHQSRQTATIAVAMASPTALAIANYAEPPSERLDVDMDDDDNDMMTLGSMLPVSPPWRTTLMFPARMRTFRTKPPLIFTSIQ